jgi:hypothetical protein
MSALNQLVTGHVPFSPIGLAHAPLHLFHVTPNVDAAPALSKASDLLAEIRELLLDAALGAPLKGAQAWLMLHALESSKAIVDALHHGALYPSVETMP